MFKTDDEEESSNAGRVFDEPKDRKLRGFIRYRSPKDGACVRSMVYDGPESPNERACLRSRRVSNILYDESESPNEGVLKTYDEPRSPFEGAC